MLLFIFRKCAKQRQLKINTCIISKFINTCITCISQILAQLTCQQEGDDASVLQKEEPYSRAWGYELQAGVAKENTYLSHNQTVHPTNMCIGQLHTLNRITHYLLHIHKYFYFHPLREPNTHVYLWTHITFPKFILILAEIHQ